MSHNHMNLDGEGRVEFLVPPKRTIANLLAVKKQTFSRAEHQALRNALPLVVARLPRTEATHGITGAELNRLGNAVSFMGLHCNPSGVSLWLATTARATLRDVIADISGSLDCRACTGCAATA